MQLQPLRPLRAKHRGNIDDAAARRHAWQQRLSQVPQPQVIDRRHRLLGRRTRHPSDVAQPVDPRGQARHQRINAGRVTQVSLEEAIQGQLRFMAIHTDHRGPLETREPRQLGANAGSDAGDDQGFVVQVHVQALLFLYRHGCIESMSQGPERPRLRMDRQAEYFSA